MKRNRQLLPAALIAATMLTACTADDPAPEPSQPAQASAVVLPSPELPGDATLADLIEGRRSTREYTTEPVTLDQVAGLLWAGYGVQSDGGRAVPSAGGRYPMTLYLVAGNVPGLDQGCYRFDPAANQLLPHRTGDLRADLASASLDQQSIADAPASIVVAGSPDRLRDRYGVRSERFAMIEAGHIGQNLALAAEVLGLGMVTIGAFDDAEVAGVLDLPADEQVYYVIPVGHPA